MLKLTFSKIIAFFVHFPDAYPPIFKVHVAPVIVAIENFTAKWNYDFRSDILNMLASVNSSPPSAAYMRQGTGSSLVQVMSCRLFDAKPLPEPVLAFCQLDFWEHISMKFESEF